MSENEIIEKIKEIDDSILYLPAVKYLKDNPELQQYVDKIMQENTFLKTIKDAIFYIKYRNFSILSSLW